MSKIRIVESVGGKTERVHSYEDIEIHHPSKKGKEPGRHYQVVDGHNEEILSSGGKVQHSRDGHVFVSKDFVLLDDKTGRSSPVHVPAPADGFVKIDKNSGLVKIYDKLPDGEMIAQVRHMDLRGFPLKDGDPIKYGQPMGLQAGMGGGDLNKYPTHTHIDFNANHLDKFKQYIRDIDSGVISTDRYPGKGPAAQDTPVTQPADSKPAQDKPAAQPARAGADGVLRQGEQGAEIRALQESLNKFGYTDARGRALTPDSDFGAHTKEALQAFQRAHGLKDDGIAGPRTLDALKKSEQSPLLANPQHPDHAMYKQAVQGLEKLGPNAGFKSHAELERAAATLTFEAKVGGLKQIDHVALSTNGTGLFAVQGGLTDPGHHRAHVDKAQAAAQPMEQSTFQLQQDAQQRQKLEQAQPVQQLQPQVSRAIA
ncbi:peptidoglycan-binding domain-containing protein [Lysobacter silvisoli]|uniref:Peptidoglycan-binding protein n=1 Tax=Lysobacter silvisoli TaxID=2293254 RepID=A0A371K4F2_9GAMM|nr:peptidoglycan-binding domain-containing protein [Lysobacter silvisoli]RDZ28734.1 peptidoglycan-binding protein [Lysobacter silvisoli]